MIRIYHCKRRDATVLAKGDEELVFDNSGRNAACNGIEIDQQTLHLIELMEENSVVPYRELDGHDHLFTQLQEKYK